MPVRDRLQAAEGDARAWDPRCRDSGTLDAAAIGVRAIADITISVGIASRARRSV
jgi:hypothetical protein